MCLECSLAYYHTRIALVATAGGLQGRSPGPGGSWRLLSPPLWSWLCTRDGSLWPFPTLGLRFPVLDMVAATSDGLQWLGPAGPSEPGLCPIRAGLCPGLRQWGPGLGLGLLRAGRMQEVGEGSAGYALAGQ